MIPAPYWVSYPEMVLLCDGEPVPVACPQNNGFKTAARGPRRGDHAEDQMADPELAVEPDAAPPIPKADLRALAEVLLKHEHVWVMTDDMYEHVVYDDFAVPDDRAGRAAALRPHADRQRRVEGLLHDRLADRLWRRPEGS